MSKRESAVVEKVVKQIHFADILALTPSPFYGEHKEFVPIPKVNISFLHPGNQKDTLFGSL